ncbi:ABC transporter permease [Petroclostridium sp. X23]|uniref:ABC transporter permease n=1 Tax=Petroclostridium sp. X23 TaxID=3045146 RepID=UPI0024AE0EED|nr:ABC transporter permease [Petroclostridium sp. X23]WHH59294.1 ABC transporter permease [Petroclostridium sp. X23]
MNFLECIRVATSCIWQNKMRSILTMLGIIIGIASVVAVVSVMQGGQVEINKSLEKFGTNRIIIQLNWREQDKITSRDFITYDDIDAIKQFGDEIVGVSPIINYSSTAKLDSKKEELMINGVSPDHILIENLEIVKGRFISESDYKGNREIIVIDEKLAKKLFNTVDVVGKQFNIVIGNRNTSVTICGVIKALDSTLGSALMEGSRSTVYMPITTVNRMYYNNYLYALSVKVANRNNIDEMGKKIVSLLHRRHHNTDKYIVENLTQAINQFNQFSNTFTLIIAVIAGISLFVGGIGIMNIMLVSVTERTREIGIRKSLGANREDILIQFLIEAVIISLMGGVLGMLTGVGIAYAISQAAKWPPVFSIFNIGLAFMVTTIIGIIFGVYPAYKAAKLDPIEALRYE